MHTVLEGEDSEKLLFLVRDKKIVGEGYSMYDIRKCLLDKNGFDIWLGCEASIVNDIVNTGSTDTSFSNIDDIGYIGESTQHTDKEAKEESTKPLEVKDEKEGHWVKFTEQEVVDAVSKFNSRLFIPEGTSAKIPENLKAEYTKTGTLFIFKYHPNLVTLVNEIDELYKVAKFMGYKLSKDQLIHDCAFIIISSGADYNRPYETFVLDGSKYGLVDVDATINKLLEIGKIADLTK